MTLITDLMRWYGCTEEAAEHIAQCAAENAQLTGVPLENDLRHIAERAGMPFYVRRAAGAPQMTLADVKHLQGVTRRLRCGLDEEEATTP